ncbi:hypothetical protein [Lacticaseibacillus saniviri]
MKTQSFVLPDGLIMEIICEGQMLSVAVVAMGQDETVDQVYQKMVELAKETYGSPIAGFEL